MNKAQEFAGETISWSYDGFHNSGFSGQFKRLGIMLKTYAYHLENCEQCQQEFLKFIKGIPKDDFDYHVYNKLELGMDTKVMKDSKLKELLFCSTYQEKELICSECKGEIETKKVESLRASGHFLDQFYCYNNECQFFDMDLDFPLMKLKKKVILPQKKLEL